MPKFKTSQLANKYLSDLFGVEIGGSAHNGFGLNTINVDYTDDMNTRFKQEEIEMCGQAMEVDVVSEGDALPFPDKSFDFVISSHVLEHIYDPIKAVQEWERVAKKYIYIIVPNKEKTFDRDKDDTPLQRLTERYLSDNIPDNANDRGHKTIWSPTTFRKFCEYCAQHLGLEIVQFLDTDDKVGNGICVLFKVLEELNSFERFKFEFKNFKGY